MTIEEKEKLFCSQGDTSGKHKPKKFFYNQKNCFVYDNQNIPYLDMQMYNSAANFGYKNANYITCITDNLNNLLGLSAEFMNENRVLLSEKICTYLQNNYGTAGRVHFTVGGAQAVDDALKLVFNYTGKKKIFAFEGAYHGRTMASSSVSSSYRYTKQFGNVIDVHRIPYPNCSRCPYGMECYNCSLYCIRQFERLFESEFHGVYDDNSNSSAYAAFILEPILGRGGYVFPSPNYLVELQKILKKYNILLIADEVQMGFYRTGKLWSFEHFNIMPDVIVFGKSITNGIWPLSGIWAREDIISPEKWPIGSTHCTFSGHPLAMALGMTTFGILESSDFHSKIQSSSSLFEKIIINLKKDFPFIGRAQVKGHAAGLDIINPITQNANTEGANKLIELALNSPVSVNGSNYGLILTYGGMFNSSIMLSPSLLITKEELELFDLLIREYFKQLFY